ncbi:cation-translocating P-type ATPase [Tropicimonas aquimaris]|uniref:Cation-translocating P-type ATPase n=1 Tax=Tropicimonas aquimaris TaxID=914152 RepID=A0ABW3ILJ8_9RHOB
MHATDRPTGLTSDEVERRRAEHGWNTLPEQKPTSPWAVLARQFTSVLVLILIVAAGVALFLGETVDAIAIGLVVALNGVLGFVQEWRAETAIQALRSMLSPMTRVVRDGREQPVEARTLVPGDLVVLDAGDNVPADLGLVTALNLRIDESVLTGESLPIEKRAGRKAAAPADDTATRAFMGTSVAAGRAEGLVTAIGGATEFGRIAGLTGEAEQLPTTLQIGIGRLARQLGVAAVGIAAAVAVVGVLTGRAPIEMVLTGLSLAVAMVPEGLPAVVTITLALGASAMVRQKALARRLQAVETLGAASVICTDKTGTLTENKMTATRVWTPAGSYEVTGTGYDPAGRIESQDGPVRGNDDPLLGALLETAITCNHAHVDHTGDGWEMTGDPTEGALVTLAMKGWIAPPAPATIRGEIPFDSERKRMSVIAEGPHGGVLHVKGAPEQVLEVCTSLVAAEGLQPLGLASRRLIRNAYETMAAEGLRVIALARAGTEPGAVHAEERELTFLGLVGLIDPPRPEVRDAIAGARRAGIRVIMITGDSPLTATAIARELDLPASHAITGAELERMSDEALDTALQGEVIFARTAPANKMRIIRTLQARNQVVAMTGDGVNDAPALEQADIGISMGQRGTDVAKGASDLVLLDDNFATIVRAIREGRRQFDNVKKFVRYLLASNAGEVIAILANLLIGGPLIFLATQILWMNLITDGVTAIALGLEKAEPGQMKRPPRDKGEPILDRAGLLLLVLFGLYTGGASLWIFYTMLPQGEVLARTAAFTAMVLFEKSSVFAFRSLRDPCWRIGWFSNPLLLVAIVSMVGLQLAAIYWPPLQTLLRTEALSLAHWLMIGALTLPLIIVPELVATVTLRKRTA